MAIQKLVDGSVDLLNCQAVIRVVCVISECYAVQKMGRGVSAGGGQSSLGYLFGSGEAPKASTNNAQAAPSEVQPASNPPPPKPAAAPQPAEINREFPAGINSTSTNNYLRADGQNAGNFITRSSDASGSRSASPVIGDMAPNLSPRRIQACESSCVSQHRLGCTWVMDRPSTKVHAAPGGGSSLGYLFGGGSN
ncbi:hypothetical protein POTOM_036358 [Populus tomentosa]|uniref:Protein SPIRAL1-like 1 n=1 Tax=Populus tomentosa TaxID=118781 RepID=A0A8X7ZAI7_POPTO|nr:hypothetical protein POTOM_036358 [Populus tomentosa]